MTRINHYNTLNVHCPIQLYWTNVILDITLIMSNLQWCWTDKENSCSQVQWQFFRVMNLGLGFGRSVSSPTKSVWNTSNVLESLDGHSRLSACQPKQEAACFGQVSKIGKDWYPLNDDSYCIWLTADIDAHVASCRHRCSL